jgi:hypothetical protein
MSKQKKKNLEIKSLPRIKVKLKDIHPNPYRDFKMFPLNWEKVQKLRDSIHENGFFEGILARKKGNRIELIYGHHRLEALKLEYSPDHVMEIPFQEDVSEADMIKMMVDENDPAYNANIQTIDEGVEAARRYLVKNRDLLRMLLESEHAEVKRARVGWLAIEKFLNGTFNKNQVQEALWRLKLYKKGISKDIIYQLPTVASANNFIRAAELYQANKEAQEKVAEFLISSEKFGERTMKEAFMRYHSGTLYSENPTNAGYCENRFKDATKSINKARQELNKLVDGTHLRLITDDGITIEDISPRVIESFYGSFTKLAEFVNDGLMEAILELKARVPEE